MVNLKKSRWQVDWKPKNGRWPRRGLVSCGLLSIFSAAAAARGQQALTDARANEAAAQGRVQQQQQLQNYTFKEGDFRMLVTPAMSLQYNDNITVTGGSQEDDFILMPTVAMLSSYPLTDRNILQLNLTTGYSEYLQHDRLSTWYLSSDSGLSFDIYIKDILVNLHDRFSYVQDSAQNPGVANTGEFGTFQNSVGPTVSWNLKKVVFSLGYDHQNEISTSSTLSQVDHSAESGDARIGYQWNPKVTTGVEGTASALTYDSPVLNNNTSYSVGAYGDWQPSSFFHIRPRAGYVFDQFSQSSRYLRTSDVGSWYADINISHDITKSLTYTLDFGHQVSAGLQSDVDENYYVNVGLNWNFIKGNRFTTSLFYQHGNQGDGSHVIPGASRANLVSETYDWYGTDLRFSHALTKRIELSFDYRITERSSSGVQRNYTQNVVALELTYHTL